MYFAKIRVEYNRVAVLLILREKIGQAGSSSLQILAISYSENSVIVDKAVIKSFYVLNNSLAAFIVNQPLFFAYFYVAMRNERKSFVICMVLS